MIKGEKIMRKKQKNLANCLLTLAALVVTGVVGFATTNATERMETIEYTVEQNESLNEKCARNMECTLKNPYKNLDDYIERCLNTDFIKKIYVKGYDREIVLAADNEYAVGEFRSNYVFVYTFIKPNTIRCLGMLESSDPRCPIAKSDGMIFVRNGDSYDRYGVTSDGQQLFDYGSVKAMNVNPKPIVLKRNNPNY